LCCSSASSLRGFAQDPLGSPVWRAVPVSRVIHSRDQLTIFYDAEDFENFDLGLNRQQCRRKSPSEEWPEFWFPHSCWPSYNKRNAKGAKGANAAATFNASGGCVVGLTVVVVFAVLED